MLVRQLPHKQRNKESPCPARRSHDETGRHRPKQLHETCAFFKFGHRNVLRRLLIIRRTGPLQVPNLALLWHFAICSAQRPLSRATGSISYNYMCGKPGRTPFCWAAADRQKALPRAKQCWYIFERHPHHIATLQTPQHLRNMDVSLTRATPTPSVSLQYIKIY